MIPTNKVHFRMICNKFASQLKANKESDQLAILKLKLALIEKNTNGIFNKNFKETVQLLEIDKTECEKRLVNLNGHFYQDQTSLLKQAWDKMVGMVKSALGITIETRDELNDILNEDVSGSKDAANEYLDLENTRNRVQTRLNLIVSVLKTRPDGSSFEKDLAEQLDKLQMRQQALNGNYYEDPQSLLDQAWQRHHLALVAGDPSAQRHLNTFRTLDEERKCNDSQLFTLRQQISCIPSPSQNIDTHTSEKIKGKIMELENLKYKTE